MTTFNGAALILQSIDSVLAQTWRDFELIVVDDCSTDDTLQLLRRCIDPRLRIVCNRQNLGIVGSRNIGFSLARGRYLAALDHDDISMPERLARQVAYLEAYPEVVLVGSRWLNLSGSLTQLDPHAMTEPFALRWALHLSNPMCYSSLMARTECVRRLIPPMRQDRVLADDFDFYHRMLAFGDIARIADPLILYRIHNNNTFRHRMQEMQRNAALVLQDAYAAWFGDRSADVAELMTRLVAGRGVPGSDAELRLLRDCLDTLATRFLVANSATPDQELAVRNSVADIWTVALHRRIRAGGLLSVRHLKAAWQGRRQDRGALIGAIAFGCIPAKRTFRKMIGWRPYRRLGEPRRSVSA